MVYNEGDRTPESDFITDVDELYDYGDYNYPSQMGDYDDGQGQRQQGKQVEHG